MSIHKVDVLQPGALPKYDMTPGQLEWFWLFGLVVAGKSSRFATEKLENYLDGLLFPPDVRDRILPFDVVREDIARGVLRERLEEVRTGQYEKLVKAFTWTAMALDITRPDLTIALLESCPGCGPKTARMFWLTTRRDARCAALDTHILKFLARQPGLSGVPAQTPPAGRVYERLERAFLGIADSCGLPPAKLDFAIWEAYSNGRGYL